MFDEAGQEPGPPWARAGAVDVVQIAYPHLLRLARGLMGSDVDAEDIVQEAFVETLSRYPGFDGLRQPLGYLTTVLYRSAYRRRRTRREIPVELAETLAQSDPDLDAPILVQQILSSLGPKQRACLLLRYLHGLDDDEIALALGCRPSTVRSQVARALSNARLGTIDEVD